MSELVSDNKKTPQSKLSQLGSQWRNEARLLLRVFLRTLVWVLLGLGCALLLLSAGLVLNGDAQFFADIAEIAEPTEHLTTLDWFGAAIGALVILLYLSFVLGVPIGIGAVTWKMVGPSALAPIFLAPFFLFLSFHFLGWTLVGTFGFFLDAVAGRAEELDHMIPGDIGAAARSPIAVVVALISLVGGVAMYLYDFAVIGTLLLTSLHLLLLIAAGLLPAFLISSLVLARAYRKRWKQRHGGGT